MSLELSNEGLFIFSCLKDDPDCIPVFEGGKDFLEPLFVAGDGGGLAITLDNLFLSCIQIKQLIPWHFQLFANIKSWQLERIKLL